MPSEVINGFIDQQSREHEDTIKAHNEKRDNALTLAQEEEAIRIAAKAQRKRDREAARKA
jgi:hypothetical protein